MPIPFISIIIPTYNRPDYICSCLKNLAALEYPKDQFEVIIVDDGGLVPLENLVSPFHARLSILLLRQTHAGRGIALNTGARKARGDIFLFTDDDCRPEEAI
jgi:glycosyltransferase involved in cell wall biosynthesis